MMDDQQITTAKLAIVILIIAALLFVAIPNLSWGKLQSPEAAIRRNSQR